MGSTRVPVPRTLDYESPGSARPGRAWRLMSPLVEYVLVGMVLLAMYGVLVLICFVGVFGVN